MSDDEQTLKSQTFRRIGELADMISHKRLLLDNLLKAMRDAALDKLPFAAFCSRLNQMEADGIQLEDDIKNLERHRDLLLVSSVLKEKSENVSIVHDKEH